MTAKLTALAFGIVFGFVLAWARVTDPMVIRRMLLLEEPDVFLLMGAAVLVAAIGVRMLRAAGASSLIAGSPIGWTIAKPARRHVVGSLIFGAGWSIAATCPGPMLAMIGQGHFGGLIVGAGVLMGLAIQGTVEKSRATAIPTSDRAAAAGCV